MTPELERAELSPAPSEAPKEAMEPRKSERDLVFWLASIAACLGVVWAIWSVPLVMSNDGPEAVLTAHMEAHYDDPGSIYARQFSIGFGLSGRGFSVLYRPLASVFSWPNSLRVSQLIMVLSLAFGFGWLCRAVSGRTRLSSLLGFAIAFSWPFYMGFYAFTIAMTVGVMVLAFVVSRSEGLKTLEKAAVSTALLLELFMHGFAVFITLALVGLVVVTRAWMRRKSVPPPEWRRATLRDAAWLVVSALPSVAVLLFMRTAQAELAGIGVPSATWPSPSDWARVFPRLVVPGSTPLGILLLVTASVAIARTALRLRRAPRRPEEVALVIGAALLLLAALALPLDVPGWQFFSPRFLTTGVALSLCLLASERLPQKRARLALDAGVLVVVAAALVNARALHRRLATACGDAIGGLDHRIDRSAFQLPIIFDLDCGLPTENARRDVPFLHPLMHFSALFPVTHGGAVPYGFFGPAAVHAFVPRAPEVPIPPVGDYVRRGAQDERLDHPMMRAGLLTDLAVFGTHYENVLMFGASAPDRALLLERGYVVDFEQGSFLNAHFVPCNVELVADILPGDPPLMVAGGLRKDTLWPSTIAPLADRPAIKASLPMICGEAWVRVQWRQSDLRCANADELGRILVRTAHGTTTRVVCERGPVR